MKRILWLSLTFSLLATNVFAMPVPEHEPSAEFKAGTPVLHETLAQDGRLILQYQRVG